MAGEPAEPAEGEQDKEQDSPEKLDKREKKVLKKKSPFLPGKPAAEGPRGPREERCCLLSAWASPHAHPGQLGPAGSLPPTRPTAASFRLLTSGPVCAGAGPAPPAKHGLSGPQGWALGADLESAHMPLGLSCIENLFLPHCPLTTVQPRAISGLCPAPPVRQACPLLGCPIPGDRRGRAAGQSSRS